LGVLVHRTGQTAAGDGRRELDIKSSLTANEEDLGE
jgi:hypothetical protein